MKWHSISLLALTLVLLSGCEDRFRYACQDPKNWEKQECKSPYCDVTQTCPEHVFADQKKMQEILEKKEPKDECPK